MRLPHLLAAAAAALLLSTFGAPVATLAHEHRTIAGGRYDVVVGWQTEPAYVNQQNAAGIRISKAGTNPAEPVTGVENSLSLQVRQGAQTRTFALRAVFGQPGYYVADILPTRAGDYVLTFTGTIGSDRVDETFDSADGRFDAVTDGSAVAFPVAEPDPSEVVAQMQAAQSTARMAQTLAFVGVAFGVLGCLAAVVLWFRRSSVEP